jgi:hypothetical protein
MSGALEAEIAALPKLGRAGLQQRWRELFKAPPPAAFTPDLLARGIAYRLQEKAIGGLSPSVRRQLERGREVGGRRPALRPGNRLVRRWRGVTYVVEVTETGFLYEGQQFGSLSEIARLITHTRWSGPRFFGVKP